MANLADDLIDRAPFEEWISGPPYEADVIRFPLDESRYRWPGQYRAVAVQMAWEAYCFATLRERAARKSAEPSKS